MKYRIQIHAAGPHNYRTTGAAAVQASNPMRSAALSLLESGADPADRLAGVFDGAQISAVTLAALVKHRVNPRSDHRSPGVSRNVD